MSFESEFLDCMPQTIVVSTEASINKYGKVTFSTVGTTYAALIQAEQTLVRALDGTEKVAKTSLHINATGTINPTDRIVLPDGTVRPILSIGTLSDDEGIHHTEIFFG